VWRRALGGVRILLSVSAAAVIGPAGLPWIVGAGLYVSFAVAWMFVGSLRRPGFSLLSHLLDAAVLLVTVAVSDTPSPWLGGVWFLFLMTVSLIHGHWRQMVIIAAGCIAFVGMARPPGWWELAAIWTFTGSLALIGVWFRRRLEDRLYSISRQAVLFRSEALQARDDERQRIAADFHDGPLQIFMSLQMRLQVARRLLEKNPEAGLKELAEMAALWQSQVAELRAFLRSMRATDVDASELSSSLSRLAETFQKETGVSTAFSVAGSLELQQPSLAVEIVQIVREALHNIRKHAHATHVAIEVSSGNSSVDLAIDDNGGGFPFAGAFNLEELDLLRVGPGTIKRRVRALNGDLTVESTPGRGASLRIHIPQ
jgi:signal transduction histidine kinase